MNKDIKVVVFDLDGTLYEDTHHFDYYAQHLCEKLNPLFQDAFMKDYKAILIGAHPLKIGMAYDADRDLILEHYNGIVQRIFNWDGHEIENPMITEQYLKPLQFNFSTLLNIGDLWWVPAAVAKHYKLTNEKAQQAFLETREYMMTPDYMLKHVPGFKEILSQLSKSKKLVLLTNSPEIDSEVILTKLGFTDFFAEKIFNGQKPQQTTRHLKSIKEKYSVGFETMLCIGDNAINEILPAKELGCQTILIDPYHISAPSSADIIIENSAELIEHLGKNNIIFHITIIVDYNKS